MQCKEISDYVILRFLEQNPQRWHNWSGDWGEGIPSNSVLNVFPPDAPAKLVLAKMRILIRRDLVDGCACGCRGDFHITPKGQAFLQRL